MEFRDRLLSAKQKQNLTTEQLSDRSGVPRGTINKLLNGETKNPTTKTLRQLARALSCSVEQLCGVSRIDLPRASDLLKGPLPPREKPPLPTPKRVPILGGVAAGIPIFSDEDAQSVLTYEEGCDFALVVHGTSMIGARIHDGDIVFLKRQDDVPDGQIAAVVIDGEATLKRVFHIKGGVQLLSENPDYSPMVFTDKEADSIRIIGRALGFQSRLT